MSDFDEIDDAITFGLLPKMRDSVVSIILWPEEPDAKILLELGAAIYLDKPIIALAWNGRRVPEGITKIARHVVVLPGDFDADELDKHLQPVLVEFFGL